ncbi:Pentatricopeptide repeat [Arabidopsis thaliana x Arabidopsis arenosa]|uniref:Pentatricopeptide repeat n=1 Tax=Arabidopsis thaliana x Arabidopsis arenosa TaxID=1240361 RepID=A0A8T1YB27_9BRAS|nr:Pentatricopeptide repeat [Arabidopsis thaliana x Arabidopsis arenosa]
MLLRTVSAATAETTAALISKNNFLDLFKRSTSISHLAQTHAQIILHGFRNDISLLTKLTQRLSDLGAIYYARDIFLSVQRPDVFLFNVLMRGFSVNESPHSSLSVFAYLRKSTDLKPNSSTYAFAISAASGFRDDRAGCVIHGQAIVYGCDSELLLGSNIVKMYFKFWRVEDARKVFDRMPEKDTILWNTMISGYRKNEMYVESIQVFRDLINESCTRLDTTTLLDILPAVAELQELRLGMQIHSLATKTGCYSHDYVLTGFISLYSKCGKIKMASTLFSEFRRPDIVAYNAMIHGYTSNGETELSLSLFKELMLSGARLKSSTLVSLVPVSGHLMLIYAIHGYSLKSNFLSHTSVSTALTTVYSKLNEIESARKLFDESPEKSLPSWNAMISGYTQNGLTEDAISLFREMQNSEFSPNPVTITCILSACAQLGALSLGKWVHDLCGSIAEARRLFDLMPKKNEVTWNTMISGYGLHGHGQEALTIFSEMLNSGIAPTPVTFLCVLYACSHAGLVKEGDEIFNSMIHRYGFEPSVKHYACVVDILGRAGHLQRALQFIEAMPIQPGPSVWETLLGACRIHKDTNLARTVSEKLFELDPDNVGYHVLLSNIHSADRNYPQAATVRQTAKKRKLAKAPGYTLIEIGETPHVFTSGDQSHPQVKAIYEKLEKLEGKMREAGYQPETELALHDVEEEERELMVKVHSERLAIAFGLIATEPGTEIRIIKNLRVCLDCHTATKLISKITERVIVVRDANRFHHFKDGVCSCGDYW